MHISDWADVDATTLAERVSNKEVTALELVEDALSAIEKVNPALNAVVHNMADKARAQARQPDALAHGPFRGVPFVVKDLDGYLAGEPYTQACRMSARFVPDHDSELIARMKKTGIIVVAKSNTPELGIMGVTENVLHGDTKNPWNAAHTPGGSSGGSAALVAARAVPMAHAGDGGGSIRIPASHCALFGLKPTRARNPLGPDAGESWGGYVQQHVLTRSVRDSAIMLDHTQGPWRGEPYSVSAPERPYVDEIKHRPARLRIAFSTHALLGKNMHADNVNAVKDAVQLLTSLGHQVEEAELPIDKAALVEAYFTQVATSVAADIRATSQRAQREPVPELFEPSTWLLGQIGARLGALDLHRSREACMAASRTVARFFERYDVFVNAVAATPPVKVRQLSLKKSEELALAVLRRVSPTVVLKKVLADLGANALSHTPNTQVANQTGCPAMSVPLFWNAQGLPIGTQFMARFGDEATLFRLAAQLEHARPWTVRRPAVVASASAQKPST